MWLQGENMNNYCPIYLVITPQEFKQANDTKVLMLHKYGFEFISFITIKMDAYTSCNSYTVTLLDPN